MVLVEKEKALKLEKKASFIYWKKKRANFKICSLFQCPPIQKSYLIKGENTIAGQWCSRNLSKDLGKNKECQPLALAYLYYKANASLLTTYSVVRANNLTNKRQILHYSDIKKLKFTLTLVLNSLKTEKMFYFVSKKGSGQCCFYQFLNYDELDLQSLHLYKKIVRHDKDNPKSLRLD